MTDTTLAAPRQMPAAIGFFEKYLTLWVALCILAGIALGYLMPGFVGAVAQAEVARVNLPVAVLIWLMIVPMLLRVDSAPSPGWRPTGAASASRCSSTGRSS